MKLPPAANLFGPQQGFAAVAFESGGVDRDLRYL
jgi:hypothetical protein